ncbi:MAG: HAMP domain-containing histidine kinase [Chloroflexi bacterium]|nr:HAMP domain-containing histidine kinase [Chloroflexota bacterium]
MTDRTANINVLLVDDDEDDFIITRDLLSDIEGAQYHLDWASDYDTAIERVSQRDYDVCLVDFRLGKISGLTLIEEMIEAGYRTPIIIMTGQGNREIDLQAMQIGAMDYLNKEDVTSNLLERTIRYAIERAKNLDRLHKYARELEVRNRELDSYTHVIAHDLTSPLHLIAGYIEQLRNSDLPYTDDMRHWLDVVHLQAYKMTTMIRQLLRLAKLRDVTEIQQVVNVQEAVDSAITRYEDKINETNANITVQEGLPSVIGNAIWLEEIFANLIGNALKYRKPGTPLAVQIKGMKKHNMAHFEIIDNGIGISEDDQEHLFEMFSRVGYSDEQGFGLGLNIVHSIVTKLGGTVGVNSSLGEGSTFWFTLPVAQRTHPVNGDKYQHADVD